MHEHVAAQHALCLRLSCQRVVPAVLLLFLALHFLCQFLAALAFCGIPRLSGCAAGGRFGGCQSSRRLVVSRGCLLGCLGGGGGGAAPRPDRQVSQDEQLDWSWDGGGSVDVAMRCCDDTTQSRMASW